MLAIYDNNSLRQYGTIDVDGAACPDKLRLVNGRFTMRREMIQGSWVEYRVKSLVVRGEYVAATSILSTEFNELLRTRTLGTIRANVPAGDGTMVEVYYRGPWDVLDIDWQVNGTIMQVTLTINNDESKPLRTPTYTDPTEETPE